MTALHFTPEEQEQYEKELREVHFDSSLGFLNAHNGLRRGSMHMAIGTAGGGKSTLVRTMMRDFLFQKKNMDKNLGLCLSEETVRDYKRQLAYGMPSHDVLYNATAISEMENPRWTKKDLFDWLRTYKPDLFVFDNITTSKFYMDMAAKQSAQFAVELKMITQEINCATLLIAHTDADITDGIERLIHLNDIRGPKSIVNLVEFGYIMQRFEVGDQFFPTLRTTKHRSQDLIHSLYSLQYNKKLRSFDKDTALDFNKFKEIFSGRNKLK